MRTRDQLPVPGTLPDQAVPIVPWARAHVYAVMRRYRIHKPFDLWDETIAALIRAVAYYKPEAGAFGPYARTAIHRACWRYVVSREIGAQRATRRGHERGPWKVPISLEAWLDELNPPAGMFADRHHVRFHAMPTALIAPSAEQEAMAREECRKLYAPEAVEVHKTVGTRQLRCRSGDENAA